MNRRNTSEGLRGLCLAVIITAAAISTAAALEVKSKDGKALDITLMSVRGDHVKFKRNSDGRIFSLKLDTFAPESVEVMRKAALESPDIKLAFPKLRIDASIGKRLDRDANSGYMRHERITGTFTITNEDPKVALGKSKFSFVYFGRNPFLKDNYMVLHREESELALPPGGNLKHNTKTFVTSFDEDRNSSNIGGYRYEGYVCVVHDVETGKIVSANSSAGHVDKRLNAELEETVKQLLELKAKDLVTKDLLPRERSIGE